MCNYIYVRIEHIVKSFRWHDARPHEYMYDYRRQHHVFALVPIGTRILI